MSDLLPGPIRVATLDMPNLEAGSTDDTAVVRSTLSHIAPGSFTGNIVDRQIFQGTAPAAVLTSGEPRGGRWMTEDGWYRKSVATRNGVNRNKDR